MQARNKHTQSPILGTLEELSGRAEVDSFERDEDGKLTYAHSGETVVFWEGSDTVVRDGGVVFLDAAGDEVLEADIELVVVDDDD